LVIEIIHVIVHCQSGYKQHNKIGKALHSRGDAIKTVLGVYAKAAAAMALPRKALT
jgi:hypothetical protein